MKDMGTKKERTSSIMSYLHAALMGIAREDIIHRADYSEAELEERKATFQKVQQAYNSLYDKGWRL